MTTKSHHVVPDPDGGWSVIKRDAARASKHFDSKEEAVVWGRQVSRKHRTEFVIHKKDGTVETKDSYRPEPLPPTDRNERRPRA